MTSSSPARVFISSTSGAVLPYRSAAADVCRRLGMVAVYMEEFSPERKPPVDVCRREVESCDVLVLLLAHRYGSRPAGHDASYTELEYRWAVGTDAMAMLPFAVDPTLPWPPGDLDRGADEEALAAFVRTVRRLSRIDEAVRPHHDLAAALIELGGPREAAEHARAAYRQAWGDGPPYCEHWDLARASRLLNRLDLRPPGLPTLDLSAWQAPLEAEIRLLIARTRERQGGR